MDYIILGLLLLQSRTIYQLQNRINKGLHLMYSSSMGSIQAAVKKLLRKDYITYTEFVEHGKYKKQYSITDAGRDYFSQWVNLPMENQGIKNPELAKLYFMGFSDRDTRETRMEAYLRQLTIQYQSLRFIYEEGKAAVIPEEGKDIAYFQLLSAKYGMDFMKFNLDWFSELAADISSGEGGCDK